MNSKLKVKIVKKTEAVPSAGKTSTVKSTRHAAREMVSTVTDWVAEFKTRRSEETKAAFDKLFSSRPQPSES